MVHEDSTIAPSHAPLRGVPERIGRYRVLGVIGDGGFGTVYEAEQTEPVRRRVALKVIKAGMDSKQVLARFEAERQALAVMDHPGIAKFLDADLNDNDRPYFVMEYVRGVPITAFCEQERLKLDDRVKLMIQVCHAVQHAHTKGVIHRDLKPGNILVELIDKKPVVKVIDFGVAKALAQPLTGSTIYTERGQMIGTPEYMSPEQARGSGVDVDTRADVYSLGAILYELLTGLTPFDPTILREKGYAELQRIIEREEAPRPSTRLTTIAKTPTGSGETMLHAIDPVAMSKRLKGDMDWIVMKCLEKERDRRYETANGLAMDLQRYLNSEPVVAGPPSVTYRTRKFVKRNKALVSGGLVVAVVLVLGIVGTTWGLLDARSQAARAERELARAVEIKQLITDILSSVDPEKAKGADITLLKGILDQASTRLSQGKIRDELIAAELHAVVGDVYWKLAQYDEADRHLPVVVDIRTRLLGPDHPDTLTAEHNLANLLLQEGRYAEAEPLYLKTLDGQKRVLGAEDPATLRAMGNLASLYFSQGRFADAEPLFLETLEIKRRIRGPEHPDTLKSMNNLATLYVQQGRHADAERIYLETRDLQKRVLGAENPNTLCTITNIGLLYNSMDRFEDAVKMFETSLPIERRVLGLQHPWTGYAMNGLAAAYMKLGRRAEAIPLYRELLQLRIAAADQPNADPSALNDAAWTLLTSEIEELRDPQRALAYAERACAGGNANIPNYLDTLALAHFRTGDTAKAIETQRRALSLIPAGSDPEMAAHLAQYEMALADVKTDADK